MAEPAVDLVEDVAAVGVERREERRGACDHRLYCPGRSGISGRMR
ncbi:MAG: hypothetical protein Q8Q09_01425 [Deltaproteobacteria bacterium]|nr:hypothetical protein [Deltaproteobacteria bacterium]